MLRVANLEKNLGAFSLRIDRLEISEPGIYGLIGPNGCGKTTAAKILSGVLAPGRGEINFSAEDREITMVSQKPYMMDDTVYNNLVYPLRLRGMAADRELCDEILEQIGFKDRRNERARGLSAGERQKLALMRALIFRPRFVILDEAMTDLDIDSLDMFEGMILERQTKDPIVWLVISHQLPHVRRLCDYIFFMSAGRIEAQGPVDELLSSQNPLVRRYLKHEIIESAGTRAGEGKK